VAVVGDVVVKLHPAGTDRRLLSARLRAVTAPGLSTCFVQPLVPEPVSGPAGRLVTAWPRLPVLSPGDQPLPWADAGALLARLHRMPEPAGLPMQGGPARLARAADRAVNLAEHAAARQGPRTLDARLLGELGRRLLAEIADPAQRHTPASEVSASASVAQTLSVVHGDWHLGQLARADDGWRLIDVDDVGVGAPAWDLARPAGFWAAGLVEDEDWEGFLGGYRAAGGPAVPPTGDPWPALDLAARCAVLIAAVREMVVQPAPGEDTGEALLAACRRM
jgi:hypothetical protein